MTERTALRAQSLLLTLVLPLVLPPFLPLALPFLLGACAVQFPGSAVPGWVNNPPADTQAEFWGVGEGPDTDAATRMALRQIAARLRVSVSAVTESAVTVTQSSVYRSDQTRVQEIVRETEFTGVTVKESARHSGGVHVLVRVDRRMFVRETAARFNELFKRATHRIQGAHSDDALKSYRALREALPHAEQALLTGQLLRVVDASAVDSASMDQLSQISRLLSESASRVKVRVEHAPVDSDVASVISQWISKAGFQQVSSNSTAALTLRVESRTDAVFDTWNCRLRVSLIWSDATGGVLANQAHEAKGSSLESEKRARQNAVSRLAQAWDGVDVSIRLGLIQ